MDFSDFYKVDWPAYLEKIDEMEQEGKIKRLRPRAGHWFGGYTSKIAFNLLNVGPFALSSDEFSFVCPDCGLETEVYSCDVIFIIPLIKSGGGKIEKRYVHVAHTACQNIFCQGIVSLLPLPEGKVKALSTQVDFCYAEFVIPPN